MSNTAEIWKRPKTDELHMITGWRQWADAGAISSGLPQYLIQQLDAQQIGQIRPDGFYLFQIPATHDLVRPVVKFNKGYPESLQKPRNELYYAGNEQRGLLIFIGDEPHLDVDRYVTTLLDVAHSLGVKRIVGLGGVYGELPYDKERTVATIYSLPDLKQEVAGLAVNLSDYHGGASIGSYVCRLAGERDIEFVGLYGFVPAYDFSNTAQIGNTIRLENDFMAWLGIMKRVNYLLRLDFDLADLTEKSRQVVELLDAKVSELDSMAPQLGIREYMAKLSAQFDEMPFDPLGEVWEEELDRLFSGDESAE